MYRAQHVDDLVRRAAVEVIDVEDDPLQGWRTDRAMVDPLLAGGDEGVAELLEVLMNSSEQPAVLLVALRGAQLK